MAESVLWGYARVSSKSQNPERQKEKLLEYGVDERHIKIDYESGKDFNRSQFLSLVGTKDVAPNMRAGDCLVILSIDRLGRNYEEIRKYWQRITVDMECDISVIDMPLLDTQKRDGNLDSRFVSDLVLQILSYVAEKERDNIRERQRQGIDRTLREGKPYGRPKTAVPENFNMIDTQWANGDITAVKAMSDLGLSKSVFYALINERCIVKKQ